MAAQVTSFSRPHGAHGARRRGPDPLIHFTWGPALSSSSVDPRYSSVRGGLREENAQFFSARRSRDWLSGRAQMFYT